MRTSCFHAVMVAGRLIEDPRLGYGPDGVPICHFAVAIVKRWVKADGSRGKSQVVVTAIARRRLAEICAQFLRAGREVFVAGTLKKTPRRDGRPTRLQIVAETVQFLSSSDGEAHISN